MDNQPENQTDNFKTYYIPNDRFSEIDEKLEKLNRRTEKTGTRSNPGHADR